MKKIILCLVVFLSVGLCSFAQSRNNTQSSGDKKDEQNDNIKDKGFDIIFAGGCYFGSKYNAQYYNGDYANENNLAFLFENKYRYDEINQMIIDHYPYISDSIHYGGPLGNMKYRVAVMVSLGVRYKFTKNWSIQC